MTANENVRAAFLGKRPERIPAGVCLGGSWPYFLEGVTLLELLEDPIRAAEIFYRVNEEVDADFVTVGTGATAFLIEGLGGDIAFSSDGAPAIASLLVQSEEDIASLDIQAALAVPKVQWLKEVAKETLRLNQNKRSIFISGRAPFTLAGQLLGLETLSKSLYKNKTLVEKLLDFTTELSVAYYEFMLEVPGMDGIFIADPSASGDVVSKRHFETWVVPYLTKVVSRLARHDKLSLVHICGNITDRLHLLPQTGIQMVSVDSKVDLLTAKEILKGQIALAGNVNPVASIEEKSPEEVYADATKCLDAGAKDGGFLLLPGCDLSAKARVENVRAITKAAHDWQVGV
ncbi:hypothetical protein FACS1894111_04470 [Clostridia bacterium]|nr:hypothetical protein FACS1894111_04470 [Clostridia bacterium]